MGLPDIEVGRLALRSFHFASISHEFNVMEHLGYWDDGTVKFWRAIAYHNIYSKDWLDGTCIATCGQHKEHLVPNEKCSCGIYGSLSYADLLVQYREEARRLVTVIAAEGRTIIGPRGLRTERAKVVAYWVIHDPVYRQVAEDQFKTASVFETPADLLDFYGLPLLPKPITKGRRGGGGANWWTGKDL